MKQIFQFLLQILIVCEISFADRNILLVSSELGNLSYFPKATFSCPNGYGVFNQAMYGGFAYTKSNPSSVTANYPVFDINNLPPHFRREVRIEVFVVKQSNVGIQFKLDNMTPVTYTFYQSGSYTTERFNIPCDRSNSDSILKDSDYYYNFNYFTTTMPTNNAYTIFSIVDNGSNSGSSYSKVKEIQYNIESCDNSCLSCSGSSTQCTSCDTVCTSQSGSSCIINQSNYVLQEGKCVAACTQPHFNINGVCVWIPQCQSVSAGSTQCTTCETGFLPVQASNYEAQCQPYCPNDYQLVNGICKDTKTNIQGVYLLQGLYQYVFSYSEINRLQLILNNFQNGSNYNSKYTRCGSYFLLGGYFSFKQNSVIQTQKYSTSYKLVRVSFKWVLIDYNSSVNPTDLTFQVIGSSSPSQTLNLNGINPSQICGLSVPEYVGDFQYDFQVPSGQVTFQINNQMTNINSKATTDDSPDQSNKNQYFGIREFSIFAFSCDQASCIQCQAQTLNICTQCMDGYYLSNSTCLPCKSTCQTCASSTNCQSCFGGAVLNSDSQCVCPNKQYWQGSSCVACKNTSCQTCDATDSNKCLTCPTGTYFINDNCVVVCPIQFFPNDSTQNCESCISNCQKCSNNSSCDICMPNTYLQIDGKSCLSNCPAGQQQNSNKGQCIKCTDPNCLQCQSDINQCTKCQNPYNLQGFVCQVNCDSSYQPVNNVCQLCSSLFPNCSLCSSLKCTACLNNYYLQNGNCYNPCPQGYYGDSTSTPPQCTNCLPICQSCSSLNSCSSCNGGAILNNSNQCVCPNQQYWNGSNCIVCSNTSCQTCDSSNSNLCLTCPNGTYLYNNTCVLSCPPKTFQNSTNQKCDPCLNKCEKCSNNSTCDICEQNLYLSVDQKQCLTNCPLGQQQNQNTWQCISCTDPNCQVCQQDPSQCSKCGNNQNLQGQICQPNCNTSYYPVNNVCVLCSSNIANCDQCTSSTCTLCQNNYYLFNGNCVNQCNPGYYIANNPPSCQPCQNSTCNTCEPAPSQNCLSCAKPYFQNGTQCVNDCDPNQYSNSSRICVLCSQTFSGCQSCTINQCNSCINPTDYLNPINNTCSNTCPSNTFKSTLGNPPQNICVVCNSNCQTCDQSSSNCTSCASNMYLQGTTCQAQCDVGYFPNASNVCTICTNNFPNCSECTNSNCLQCKSPYYIVKETNNCQLQCPPGYASTTVNGSNQCIKCSNTLCKECSISNLNSCISCFQSSSFPYLQVDNCVSNCSSNYYLNNQNQCILCSSTFLGCATCSTSACLSCTNPNQYLDITTNSCVDSCAPPLVSVNSPPKQCVQNCNKIPSCIKCITDSNNNNQTCQQCNNGMVLDQNLCVSNCPSEKYVDSQNICQPCNALFQGCKACTSTTCSLCLNSNEYFDPVEKICTSQCIYGANPLSPSSQCQACSNLNCKSCQSNNLNQCTSCDQNSKYPYLQNGDCVQSCSSYFYLNGNQCVLCSNKFTNCNTCTSNNCIQCNSNYYLSIDQLACNLNCPSKQYQTNVGGINVCQSCLNTQCLTCDPSNSMNCLSCDQSSNSKYLENNQCNSSCSSKNYADQNNICQPCDFHFQNCQSCTLTQCLQCKGGLYLDPQTNICSTNCPLFKYKDQKTFTCQKCLQQTECQECDPQFPNECIKCAKPYFIMNKQCVPSCPIGTFGDNNQICQPCGSLDSNCIRCDPGYCIQCKQNDYYLDKNKKQCVTQCPAGFTKKTDVNGIQVCVLITSGGATPQLIISNQVSKSGNKIIFQAQITFDEDVQVTNQNWIFNLDNDYPSTDYDISYDLVKMQDNPAVNDVYTLKIMINIIVNISTNSYSKLNVNFINSKNILDNEQFGLKVIQLSGDLPNYSEQAYPKVNSITKVIQILILCSHVLLLLGSPFYLLVSLFDILQLSNYLLYLNVQYQPTLYNVLKLLDFANFEIIPNIKNSDSNAPYKFKMENVDTFFFSNLVQSISIWSFTFILYLACKFIARKCTHSQNIVVEACRNYYRQYFYQILVGLGFLTYCDLLLAVFLQFYDSSQITVNKGVGLFFGVSMLSVIIYLNYLTFNSTKIQINELLYKIEIKQLYGFLYNGIEINRKKAIINLLLLFRRTIVIQQLVFNQESPINQTYICCLVLGIETTVMLILRPYQSQEEFKLHIISRLFLISAMILIIILAINDAVSNLSQAQSLLIQIIISVQIITIYITQVSYLVYKLYRIYKQKNYVSNNIRMA
ncbi:hypothetical protein ABPG74_004223 [Tetrahymena malaccensis]